MIGRRAERDSEQAFVIEGPILVGEAVAAGANVESVYVTPGYRVDVDAPVYELADGVLERVADTTTPQPVLAVVAMRWTTIDAVAGSSRPGPIIVCVDVRDPGNLGTILRSAEASGARGVICCDGTVDVYNPKCVRASAGAVFHVPVTAPGPSRSTLGSLGAAGFRRLATGSGVGDPYDTVDLRGQVALVLGNEAHGLPSALADVVDGAVHIPLEGRAESLNVGMACAVLCFEAWRQRSREPSDG